MGKQGFDTRHNIIDISKVTVHIAMIIDGNGLLPHDFIGKFEIGHIRPTKRTIDRKKTQSCRRNPIKMTVGIRHEFIGFFCSRIKTDRMVDWVCDAKGGLFLIAINGGT
mgnify:CR=1 FL=1